MYFYYTQLIWFSTTIIHSHKSYSVFVLIVTQLYQLNDLLNSYLIMVALPLMYLL